LRRKSSSIKFFIQFILSLFISFYNFIFKQLFVTPVNKMATYSVKKLLDAFFVNTESETDLGIY
jgi:hypothetical protein